jgi:hypothetical protein
MTLFRCTCTCIIWIELSFVATTSSPRLIGSLYIFIAQVALMFMPDLGERTGPGKANEGGDEISIVEKSCRVRRLSERSKRRASCLISRDTSERKVVHRPVVENILLHAWP